VSGEIVLPRRAIAQPRPFLVDGGDCGACVLAGLAGATVADAYDNLALSRQGFDRAEMATALTRAKGAGLLDRVVEAHPSWPVLPRFATFGAASQRQWQPWSTYIRMALDAGYYGLAEVAMDASGVDGPGPDHWVLLCGWRMPTDSALAEVLVSCSARHPEGRWVRIRDFVTRWGGFNALLARPTP
jgi:hypothetical protein